MKQNKSWYQLGNAFLDPVSEQNMSTYKFLVAAKCGQHTELLLFTDHDQCFGHGRRTSARSVHHGYVPTMRKC